MYLNQLQDTKYKNMNISKKKFDDINLNEFDTIIDVRSPSEFEDDHIIKSINLPVLNNSEREIVGKIYVQDSKFKARLIGASLITKNISIILEKNLFTKPRNWKPLIYCWRGGKRSYSLAKILSDIGWEPTILEKGYKNYRKCVVETLHKKNIDFKILLISGHTGTGKTELLNILKQQENQILDLELIANHKGSLLGAEKTVQPTQKLFESAIFRNISKFDKDKPLIIEAESNKIGNLIIPPSLWKKMKSSLRIEIKSNVEDRVQYLEKKYLDLTEDINVLVEKLSSFSTLQGKRRVSEWIRMAKEKKFKDLAKDLIINHYDPRYQNSLDKNSSLFINRFEVNPLKKKNLEKVSKEISSIIFKINSNHQHR